MPVWRSEPVTCGHGENLSPFSSAPFARLSLPWARCCDKMDGSTAWRRRALLCRRRTAVSAPPEPCPAHPSRSRSIAAMPPRCLDETCLERSFSGCFPTTWCLVYSVTVTAGAVSFRTRLRKNVRGRAHALSAGFHGWVLNTNDSPSAVVFLNRTPAVGPPAHAPERPTGTPAPCTLSDGAPT